MAIVGDAYIAVHAITIDFESEVEDAITRLRPQLEIFGNDIGNSFADAMKKAFGGRKNLFGNLGAESEAARNQFNALTRASYKMVPAIFGAIAAVGDLVFGLGALVSALGRATPALAVVANGFSALAQAAITAKLAFGGIGKAVSAINKGGGGNQKAIEDARRRLALVYQRTNEAIAESNDKVREAQEALNQAYKEGAEALQQLGFDAEDAALAQDRAAIALERARETLMRSQDLSPDSRARREAELAFREAELNYRKTTDQVNDLRNQQEYAAKTGIEGTQEVLDAKNKLAEAEADRAKQERDSAQDIADAQRALAEALAQSSAAMSEALKDLSPEAQKFAKYLSTLKPILKELKAAAGKELFGPLQEAIQKLVDVFVPVLKPILRDTGEAIGQFAKAFADMLANEEVVAIFQRVFGVSNIKLIKIFGEIFVNLAEALLRVMDAARPLAKDFAKFLRNLSESAANAKNLDDKMTSAADAIKRIGKAIGSIFGGLKDFFALGADAGLKIFDAFGLAGEALSKFSKENAEEIKGKFDQIADNIIAMGGVLVEVTKLLFTMAGNKGVEKFLNIIAKIPALFEKIGPKVVEETAVAFGDFLYNFAELISLFLETGSIKAFFDVLNTALKIAIDFFKDENVQRILIFFATLKGFLLGIGSVGKVIKFFSSALFLGPIIKFAKGIGTIITSFGRFRAVWFPLIRQFVASFLGISALGTGPFLLIIAAIAGVVYILYQAYQNSEILREAIGDLMDKVGKGLSEAFQDVKDAIKDVMPSFEGMDDFFKTIGDFLGEYIVPIIGDALYGAIRLVGGVMAGVIKIGGGLFEMFQGVYNIIEGLVLLIQGDFSGAFDKMKEGLGNIGTGIENVIEGVLSPISWIWEDEELQKVPTWMDNMPDKGKPLGTYGKKVIAQSQQDYIDLITGKKKPSGMNDMYAGLGLALQGSGTTYTPPGGTPSPMPSGAYEKPLNYFNINPSEKMNEVELAEIISRKVAWNMRRGGVE